MIFKVTFYVVHSNGIFKSGIVIITGNASINICVLMKWKKSKCKGIDCLIWKWTICGPVISLPCVAGPGFCSLLSVLQIADQCSHTGDPLTSPTKRFGYPFTCLGNKTPSTPRRLLFFSCQWASIPFPSLLFYIFSSHIWSGGPKCYNSS